MILSLWNLHPGTSRCIYRFTWNVGLQYKRIVLRNSSCIHYKIIPGHVEVAKSTVGVQVLVWYMLKDQGIAQMVDIVPGRVRIYGGIFIVWVYGLGQMWSPRHNDASGWNRCRILQTPDHSPKPMTWILWIKQRTSYLSDKGHACLVNMQISWYKVPEIFLHKYLAGAAISTHKGRAMIQLYLYVRKTEDLSWKYDKRNRIRISAIIEWSTERK